MKKIGMVERTLDAKQFVEQGHVRVGIELVTDPAFLVSAYAILFFITIII